MTLLMAGLWEWRMRSLQLRPGDVGDSNSGWAEQRRRIDHEDVKVAIVGDSRIFFGTDLSRFQALTGVRPVQLALVGTNGLPVLEDLAADPKFKGLVLVGMADPSYFREDVGFMKQALATGRWESPSSRASFQLHKEMSHHLALMDQEYRLSLLVFRLDPGLRPKTEGPYDDVWKISRTFDDRQTYMWERILTDKRLRDHARFAWHGFKGDVASDKTIATVQARTRAALAKIRARGGDVIFVRPPDAIQLRVNEEHRIPKAKGWTALLAAVHAKGVHIDDLPQAQGLIVPEWSHLTRACATVFTDAYVRRLTVLTGRLTLRPDAPAALSSADCVKTG